MRMQTLAVAVCLCLVAPLAGADDSTKVTGTMIIPADVPSFTNQMAVVRLYEYHPLLADAPATLVERIEIKGLAHTKGKETTREFVVGASGTRKRNPQMRYYVTLFLHPGDKGETGPRTHMGKARGAKGILNKVLTQGNPNSITLDVRPVGGARPRPRPAVKPAPRPMPGPMPRPMPRPMPGGKAKPAKTTPKDFARAGILITARLKKVIPGPMAKSMPPIYSSRLVLEVQDVHRGEVKVGSEITAYHRARQMQRPTFPEGQVCLVGIEASRGSMRVLAIQTASKDLLAAVKQAANTPLGWKVKDGKLVSPWAPLGAQAWPQGLKPLPGQAVCSVTGRPAVLAGKGVTLKVEKVPPPKQIKWTNPDGDGEYQVIVSNETDQPIKVMALLSDGKKILWEESLVIRCQGKAHMCPGGRGISALPQAVVLKPGQVVSTKVNALLLKGIKWPRGGYRISFQFCLGELSVTKSFYYMSRHHDKIRAAAVKAAKEAAEK